MTASSTRATREQRGPLAVHAKPNGLGHLRLGMSVSRKVGNAVHRNRIRRRLREAYRLLQHDLPAGYDLVVVVRPHAPLMLADYQRLLSGALIKLHSTWTRRAELNDGRRGKAETQRATGDAAGAPPAPVRDIDRPCESS